MKLSRRLMLLVFGLALPVLLLASLAIHFGVQHGVDRFSQHELAMERAQLHGSFEQLLQQRRDEALAVRGALEMGRTELLDHLLVKSYLARHRIFGVNHHGELRPLLPNSRPADGTTEAWMEQLEPALKNSSYQAERAGYGSLESTLLAIVSLPMKHRQWRGLLLVQPVNDELLRTMANSNPRIRNIVIEPDQSGSLSPLHLSTLFGAPLKLQPEFRTDGFDELNSDLFYLQLLQLAAILLTLAALFFLVGRATLSPLRRMLGQIEGQLPNHKQSQPLKMPVEGELGELASLCNDLFRERHHHRQQKNALLRAVSDAIVVVDHQGRIELVNPVAERLLAVDHGPVRQCTLANLVSGMAGQELHGALLELLGSGRVSQEGKVQIPRGRRWQTLEYSAARTLDGEGRTLGAVMVLRDMTHSEQMKQELQKKSERDQTTGLFNRHVFERTLEGLAKREGQHAVCYMDLNRFKLINDSCGHEAGDRMLRDVAQEMSQSIRQSDTLARIGGDEFGLILPDTSALEAARLLKALSERVHGITLYWDSGSYKVGVSIGVAFYRQDEQTPREAFKDAEIACSATKSNGGESQIHFFDSLDQDLAHQRNAPLWAMRINDAIVNDDLVLYYQPIEPVHGNHSNKRKVEILLRIKEEGGRILAPGQFIAAAERFNLMPQVDRAVIRKAFEWLGRNPQLWDTQVIAINLSGTTLSSDGLVNYIDQMASTYRIPTYTVCFEVTETAAIGNENHALEILHSLRRRGYAFALDDFGSGFASYGYLRQLPVDYVKIDGCFVRNLATNAKDYAIVKSIHDVCRVMGIETVAEFVEDQETLQRLKAIGVTYAQGYGIGRPKDLETYQPVVDPIEEMVEEFS
ncbi:putative bifunctional diguanylate cyclase/phosphodiesterase [Ferrimonas marina]|uniref:Diguanylate cyclase/phosphodiesterase with PAS/PAC sensor(S) n=1 Tax=Ferrimonas marina TaxID=299255 RepID=A0A1M5XE64_9GAMM|nr:EAL domain-containing protein [Ferrimonas marina]SHH98101.1 diguanylate cyclase/phosphodiesterase with PAS/PAC sensor(s) [Ferrimonas marina]